MKELIEKINAEYEAFSKEAEQQVEKGNKAAGTRARKAALELSKLFKDFRKLSVEESKNKKAKKSIFPASVQGFFCPEYKF